MKGTTLTFIQKVETGRDALNEPIYTTQNVVVDNCLIAPTTEPLTAREQQAMTQSRDQVRFHLPKAFTGDITNSNVNYQGKLFHLDSDSVTFMDVNTPTAWNRYIRGENVNV